MQIVRIFTGDDGESYFGDLTPAELAELVSRHRDGPISLMDRGAGPFFEDFHNAPRRQCVVRISGDVVNETADGSRRHLVPGDVLVAEDVTGHGHKVWGEGTDQRISLVIPLAPEP